MFWDNAQLELFVPQALPRGNQARNGPDLRDLLMLAKVRSLEEKANSGSANLSRHFVDVGYNFEFSVSTPIIVIEYSSSICDTLL